MNDFPTTRRRTSGARFLQKSALVVSVALVLLFLPLYLSLDASLSQPLSSGVLLPAIAWKLLLALFEAALLVALWRAYALHRWGCAVLGFCAWLATGLGMITIALIPIAVITAIAFFMILVEEWPNLKSGF